MVGIPEHIKQIGQRMGAFVRAEVMANFRQHAHAGGDETNGQQGDKNEGRPPVKKIGQP